MPSTLDLCEKYYGTRDIYELMGITKDSLEEDARKAYYKLSLKVHPDRVPAEEKDIATEKFKVLSIIHAILTDKDKKALYDESGVISDDGDKCGLNTWLDFWKNLFKPITTDQIAFQVDNFKRKYVGSQQEMADIKKAYSQYQGCISKMLSSIPFMSVQEEPRLQKIVREWIAAGEVPEYKLFTEEPKSKRTRRLNEDRKEALEFQQLQQETESRHSESLEQLIMKRYISTRENQINELMAKYTGVHEEDNIDAGLKRKTSKKNGGKNTPEHKVGNGRVTRSRYRL